MCSLRVKRWVFLSLKKSMLPVDCLECFSSISPVVGFAKRMIRWTWAIKRGIEQERERKGEREGEGREKGRREGGRSTQYTEYVQEQSHSSSSFQPVSWNKKDQFMSFGKTLSVSIVYNVQTSLNLSKALVVGIVTTALGHVTTVLGHVTTALGHVINILGHVIIILAHNHMQFCQKTQRQCNRTCYTLEGGTIESQIFCVCIPWSSYHTCLGQT